MDKNVAVNGTSVRVVEDGKEILVGRDVKVTLPAITPITTEVNAMGTFSVPVIGQLEDMEAVISNQGVDPTLVHLIKQENRNIVIRFVQQIFREGGASAVVGCKAEIRGFPKVAAPQLEPEKGNVTEFDTPIGVTYYKFTRDGEVLWEVDRLNHILKVGGKDYYQDIESLL